jgi:hypothetical protein
MLVAMLAKAHSDGTLDKQLTLLARPKLLIIDDLGYLPVEANAAHLLPTGIAPLRKGGNLDHLQPVHREMGRRLLLFGGGHGASGPVASRLRLDHDPRR